MDKETKEMFQEIIGQLQIVNTRLDKVDSRLDRMENRMDAMEVKQDKMQEQLTELQHSQKLFEIETNKKLARLQDGMDTIEEILKMNELIPR